jgi:hypothetical protein
MAANAAMMQKLGVGVAQFSVAMSSQVFFIISQYNIVSYDY